MRRIALFTLVAFGTLAGVAAACGSFGQDTEEAHAEAGSSPGDADGPPPENLEPPEDDGGTDAACGVADFSEGFDDFDPAQLEDRGWSGEVQIFGGQLKVLDSDPTHPGPYLGVAISPSEPKDRVERAFLYRVHPPPGVKCPAWHYTLKFKARVTSTSTIVLAGPRLAATFADLDAGATGLNSKLGVGVAFNDKDLLLNFHDDACKQLPGECGDASISGHVLVKDIGTDWNEYQYDIVYFATAGDAGGRPQYGRVSYLFNSADAGQIALELPLAKGILESQLGVTHSQIDKNAAVQIDDVSIQVVPAER